MKIFFLINFPSSGEPEVPICCVILAQNRVLCTRLPVQLKALACFCLFGLWPKIQPPVLRVVVDSGLAIADYGCTLKCLAYGSLQLVQDSGYNHPELFSDRVNRIDLIYSMASRKSHEIAIKFSPKKKLRRELQII